MSHTLPALAAAAVLSSCSEDGIGPPVEGLIDVALSFERLPAPQPDEGSYEAWAVGSDGSIRSAGRFSLSGSGTATVTSPIQNPEHFMITLEPPGDDDDQPSSHKLLGGRFADGVAELDLNRYVTAGIPLEETPGTHALFTPSDNAELGYPSFEDAGIWVFNVGGDTLDGSFFITLTPLTVGWSYEGWAVRDYGTPDAVWLSYGKFAPDNFKRVRYRDDTGLGVFSGQQDYRYAMPLEVVMPGDDWLVNKFSVPVPGNLTLPLDLNGDATKGIPSRFTHVITIEPWGPQREPEMPHEAEPFFLRPYRNPIGEGTAEVPRTIEYHPAELPRGTATLVPTP